MTAMTNTETAAIVTEGRKRSWSFHLPTEEGPTLPLPEDFRASPFRRKRYTSIAETTAQSSSTPHIWSQTTIDPADEPKLASLTNVRMSRILQALYDLPSLVNYDDLYGSHGHVILGEHRSHMKDELRNASKLISSQNKSSVDKNSADKLKPQFNTRNHKLFSSLRVTTPRRCPSTVFETGNESDSESSRHSPVLSRSSVTVSNGNSPTLEGQQQPTLSAVITQHNITAVVPDDEILLRTTRGRRDSETFRNLNAVSPVSY